MAIYSSRVLKLKVTLGLWERKKKTLKVIFHLKDINLYITQCYLHHNLLNLDIPFAYFCLGIAAYLLIKWLHSVLQTAWILLLAVLVFAHLLKALSQHCGSQLSELICWHMFCTLTSDIHSVSI